MKKAIIAGASGMVGQLVLDNCLELEQVKQVISLVRRKTGREQAKLKEVVVDDFGNYAAQAELFKGLDVAFFCIGVYTGKVPDEQFRAITVDYAVAFAEALKANSPNVRLCLLSGAGADRSEKSRTSFARYKGMAENRISDLGLAFHTFRPGYIYPVMPRKEPNIMYKLTRALYPVIKLLGGSNSSIKSTELAKAMVNVGIIGAKNEILENRDILSHSTS